MAEAGAHKEQKHGKLEALAPVCWEKALKLSVCSAGDGHHPGPKSTNTLTLSPAELKES